MPIRFAPLAFVLTLALAACGDDSTGPEDVDLSGSWTYSATIEQEDAESCRIEDAPLTLEQNGDLLSGTLEIGTIQCGNANCPTLESVSVNSGRHREGGGIEFEAFFLDHDGEASPDRLQGDLVANRVELECDNADDDGPFLIVIRNGPGTWEATR